MAEKKKNALSQSAGFFGDYLLMLLAPCVMACYYCGERALKVLLVSIGTAVFCDLTGGLLFYNKIVLKDLCAVFTGTAIALMMPSTVPYYIPVIACVFAIVAVKIPFGGALKTPVVPAAAGFAFACVCFSAEIFRFPTSGTKASGMFVGGESLAAMLQKSRSMHLDPVGIFDILSGSVSGPMGTGCAIALVGCAAFLLIRRPKAFCATSGFLLTAGLIALLFPRVNTGAAASLILELCSGSLLFAAVFFVTDPATCPDSALSCLFYGGYTGILCMLTRYFGIYEEGVCFAVVVANCSYPSLEKAVIAVVNGLSRKGKGAAS